MTPETHLQLHHIRSTELRHEADNFRLAPRNPHNSLRTQVGWTMVELGLRLIPSQPALPAHSSRTA
jgi:hypothetical protein